MGGLRVRRIGELGNLRHYVSQRGGKVAGFAWWRHATSLARRRQGNILRGANWGIDGGPSQLSVGLHHRDSHSVVPDSWASANLLHRYLHVRRRERRAALSGESIRDGRLHQASLDRAQRSRAGTAVNPSPSNPPSPINSASDSNHPNFQIVQPLDTVPRPKELSFLKLVL